MEFVNGLFFKEKHENSPSFVLGKLSIKREDLIEWLQNRQEDWINCDILTSKKTGNPFIKVDDYKKESKQQSVPEQNNTTEDTDDLPF